MCRDNRYVHTFKAVPLRLVRAVTKTVVLFGMCSLCTYIGQTKLEFRPCGLNLAAAAK